MARWRCLLGQAGIQRNTTRSRFLTSLSDRAHSEGAKQSAEFFVFQNHRPELSRSDLHPLCGDKSAIVGEFIYETRLGLAILIVTSAVLPSAIAMDRSRRRTFRESGRRGNHPQIISAIDRPVSKTLPGCGSACTKRRAIFALSNAEDLASKSWTINS